MMTASRRSRGVRRPHLDDELDRVVAAWGGAVTGPAGSGKTVAVSDWASGTTVADVAWLTVDRRHRDPHLLAGGLFDAVRRVLRDVVPEMTDDPVGAVERLARAVDQRARCVVVVIDGTELLDGAASLDVIRPLTWSDRRSLRVVMVGRWLPDIGFDELARRGELVSITGRDLRFSQDETAQVIRSICGAEVGADQLAQLDEQIEGWALGVVLGGLALLDRGVAVIDADAAIDSHRVFDEFFRLEVFAAQPPDIQRVLLDTCILDRLELGLCAELSARDDMERVLRDLERRNVFIERVGGRPLVFRCHPLLRSWLRGHLDSVDPGRATQLLHRAGAWSESNGRSADAIGYYLEAGDVASASASIIAYGPRAIVRGASDELAKWIMALPPGSVSSSEPLLILLGEAAIRSGHRELTTAARALGEGLLSQKPESLRRSRRSFELAVTVQRSRELQGAGRLVEASGQARQALAAVDFAALPDDGDGTGFDDFVRATDVSALAAQFLFGGDFALCARVSRWLIETYRADDPECIVARVNSLGKLGLIELLERSRPAAAALAYEAVSLCRFHGIEPVDVGFAELVLLIADPQSDRADLDRRVQHRANQTKLTMHACLVNLFRAWSYVQAGDLPAAQDLLAEAEHGLESLLEPGMLVSLHHRVRSIVDSGVDEPVLSGRPLEVLTALSTGASRRSVADHMNLSLNTIKTYARQAFRALGVHSLSAAVERCRELGIALEPAGQDVIVRGDGATRPRSGGDSVPPM